MIGLRRSGALRKRRAERRRKRSNALMLLILGLFTSAPSGPRADDTLARGIQLFEQRQYREAEAIFKQITAANERDAAGQHYLGRIYLVRCDYDQAIAYLQRAADSEGNRADHYFWLGRAYGEKARRVGVIKQAGLAKKVRQAFERAVALDPNNAEARTALGNFYAQAPGFMGGGVDKAIEQARTLAALDPLLSELLRARILEEQRKLDDADAAYKKLEEHHRDAPRAFELHGQYGKFLLRRDRAAEAIGRFESQVALRPDSVSARFDLASAYEAVGRAQDAVSERQKAAAISPGCKPPKN